MLDDNKYWIVHGGSDSHFAARNAIDAWERVKEMNDISLEYNMPPTSKVEVAGTCSHDILSHNMALSVRDADGDEHYFQP